MTAGPHDGEDGDDENYDGDDKNRLVVEAGYSDICFALWNVY